MIVKSYAVFCDRLRIGLPLSETGCYSWPGEQTNTSKDARALARRQGWKRIPNPTAGDGRKVDLCPVCAQAQVRIAKEGD